MKKVRNILLIITILGYAVFIQITLKSNSDWVQSKENKAREAMNRNNAGSAQLADIELEPVYIELNKGMDPTPIPTFPPKIVSGERTDRWDEDRDGIFEAD
jgi:hypothetical protein